MPILILKMSSQNPLEICVLGIAWLGHDSSCGFLVHHGLLLEDSSFSSKRLPSTKSHDGFPGAKLSDHLQILIQSMS